MAKRTAEKAKPTAESLKELIWQQVMKYGGNLEDAVEGLPDEVKNSLSQFADSTRIEIPAFVITLQQANLIIEDLENYTTAGESLMAHIREAMRILNEGDLLTYHEREMQRHAEAANTLNKKK